MKWLQDCEKRRPVNMVRRSVSCKAFKACSQLTHMYVQYIVTPRPQTHTSDKHFKLMCSDKVSIATVRICHCVGGECALDENS